MARFSQNDLENIAMKTYVEPSWNDLEDDYYELEHTMVCDNCEMEFKVYDGTPKEHLCPKCHKEALNENL